MKTIEQLLDDLIDQAGSDEGRSAETAAIREDLVARYGELEKRADAQPLRTVPGGQDPVDQERGSDLPPLRWLAADPGAADDTTGDAGPLRLPLDPMVGYPLRVTDPLAAGIPHRIHTWSQQYIATADGYPEGHGCYVAEMRGFVCGPCRTWEAHRSAPELSAAIERHTGRSR